MKGLLAGLVLGLIISASYYSTTKDSERNAGRSEVVDDSEDKPTTQECAADALDAPLNEHEHNKFEQCMTEALGKPYEAVPTYLCDEVAGTDQFDECVSDPEGFEPAPEEADVTYKSNCTYVLGDFTPHSRSGYRFVATAQLTNKGSIGARVKVIARWFQIGKPAIKRSKVVHLPPWDPRARVNFTVPVGSDEIDLIQSLGYDNQCRVRAVVIETDDL